MAERMATLADFSRVVSEIYACSIDPAKWASAMAEISHALNATGSGIVMGTGSSRSVMLGAGMPAEAIATYSQYYHSIDFILQACEDGPAGLVRGGREIVANNANSEFYADWQRPFDLTDGLFVQLSAGPTPISFAISAPARGARFDTAERVQFVSALIPHLRQALRTQNHLADLGKAVGEVTEIIDATRHGVIIVDMRHEVVHLNSAAEQILKSTDGLAMPSRTIQAADTTANEQLQRVITNALVKSQCGARSGGSTACSRPSGKRPYIIHVTPLGTTPAKPAPKALVTIIDPEQEPEPPKELIKRLFGLTNAEADVALRTMRGDGLKPIAADLGLSRATVNTHLQHIFDKTDTHRQAELVRLLVAIIP